MPPEGGGGGDIPLGAEKRMWHHDRALLISSWYGVPPVRRSPRCAWGWGVAWDAGLPHKTLLQPPNAGTAEPFRVSPPEAVAYPLELCRAQQISITRSRTPSFHRRMRSLSRVGTVGPRVWLSCNDAELTKKQQIIA